MQERMSDSGEPPVQSEGERERMERDSVADGSQLDHEE